MKRILLLVAIPVVAASIVAFALGGAASASGESHGLRYVQTTKTKGVEALPSARARAVAAAIWCGTPTGADLVPNAIAGHPVHWIYAIPSDGSDQFSTVASLMQTDAEEIDAWWRREDPLRAPRNDLAALPCGQQLDLTSLRLPISGGQLTSDSRFGNIFNALSGGSFRSQFTKYIVYYDGPVTEDDVCGQGGSDGSGIGLAVVYVQACQGVSTAAVAVHELLHTFGAVPDDAPHNCPPPNDGHTCDNESDLMHPFISDDALSTKLLDPGRDDYYGHAAPFSDSQDAPWLVQLDRQQPFTVTVAGAGSVVSDVPGLQCAQSCTTTWNAGTRLTLSGVPRPGMKLARWSGACSGSGTCGVTIGSGASVSALFAPLTFRLSVAVSGRGTVRSSRSGITCRPRCAASFPSFVPLRLTATPAKGWRFRSWAGTCSGRNRTCTVPMTAASSARAAFVRA